jgi:hypothetical protein
LIYNLKISIDSVIYMTTKYSWALNAAVIQYNPAGVGVVLAVTNEYWYLDNNLLATGILLVSCLLYSSTLRWRQYFPPKSP